MRKHLGIVHLSLSHLESREVPTGRRAALASSGILRAKKRRRGRSALAALAREELNELPDVDARRVLCKQVGRINIASDFTTCIIPVRTFSWTQRVCVSMCLNFPRPARLEMPSEALESVHTRTGTFSPKSIMID